MSFCPAIYPCSELFSSTDAQTLPFYMVVLEHDKGNNLSCKSWQQVSKEFSSGFEGEGMASNCVQCIWGTSWGTQGEWWHINMKDRECTLGSFPRNFCGIMSYPSLMAVLTSLHVLIGSCGVMWHSCVQNECIKFEILFFGFQMHHPIQMKPADSEKNNGKLY